jgi:two-component sensor histidine kinase
VALAVTEACTNVVKHAYPDRAGDITLIAWTDDHCLNIKVAGDGVGLDAPESWTWVGLQLIRAHAELNVDTGAAHGTTLHIPLQR